MDKQELENGLVVIENTLNDKSDTSDPNSLVVKLNDITNVMGLAAKLCSESERLYTNAFGDVIITGLVQTTMLERFAGSGMNERKAVAEKLCSNENELCHRADRLYNSLVHAGENLRTLISYVKEEQKLI